MYGDGALIGHDPDCWHCPHFVHSLPCDFCDCLTSTIGAAYSHEYDMEDD